MKHLAWLVGLFGLVAGAVALDGLGGGGEGPPGRRLGGARLASLESFADCGEVEAWFEAAAASPAGGDVATGGGEVLESSDLAAAPQAAAAGPGGATATRSTPDHSGTNVQEASVDEPDVVKTDGELVVAAVGGRLHVVDAASRRPLATLDLPGDTGGGEELLLHGDRLLVVGRAYRFDSSHPGGPEPQPQSDAAGSGGVAIDMVAPGEETTTLTAVDLADPAAPRVLGTAELDGGYVSARLVGETARVILRQYPQVQPAEVRAADVLPAIAVDGGEPEPVPCESVVHPGAPAGPGTTTVVTLDVTGSLDPVDTDTVVADTQTVYASTDRLYVVTQRWDGEAPGGTTEVHAFATGDADRTDYVGSGQAPGWLLNQFSLSEHEGVLRVATTDGGGDRGTDSMVTTFVEAGGRLEPAGQVRGLGPGEQIFAVRYLGDVAYVVTFRQTDPLYAVDLSDPRRPRLLGELKIPGFSSYLHPVGEGRLLGVGQDATEEGRSLGTQISLFDVADPTQPRRLDTVHVADATSPVEYDHRAFLWWAPSATAVVPVEVYGAVVERPMPVEPDGGIGDTPAASEPAAEPPPPAPELFALAVTVSADGVDERGRISHTGRESRLDHPALVTRSLVVGDTLWTLSDAGLLASDLETLADRTWLPF